MCVYIYIYIHINIYICIYIYIQMISPLYCWLFPMGFSRSVPSDGRAHGRLRGGAGDGHIIRQVQEKDLEENKKAEKKKKNIVYNIYIYPLVI